LHPIRVNITFTMEGDANISDMVMGVSFKNDVHSPNCPVMVHQVHLD